MCAWLLLATFPKRCLESNYKVTNCGLAYGIGHSFPLASPQHVRPFKRALAPAERAAIGIRQVGAFAGLLDSGPIQGALVAFEAPAVPSFETSQHRCPCRRFAFPPASRRVQ